MKALLLIAHGSRRQRSNDEVIALAEKLKTECAEHYDIVQAAFLELADTLIADGIENCVRDGASQITVDFCDCSLEKFSKRFLSCVQYS